MHQHPRSPAVPSAATRLPSNPSAARDDPREHDSVPPSPSTDIRTNPARGLGIDAGAEAAEQTRETAQRKEAITKLNQIISNYHTKAALIILHSRVELPASFNKGSDSPRINRWFNVELEDTDAIRDQLVTWRACNATEKRPPPLIIETFLDGKGLTNNQSLVILDDNGKRWDVLESLAASRGASASQTHQSGSDEIILERWKIELGESPSGLPADLSSILPTVYKKSIVLFRSLFTYSKFLPAWKFSKRNTKVRRSPALQLRYRVIDGSTMHRDASRDHLTTPLYEGNEKVVDTYSFGVTESPAGPFSVSVTYRTNCDFRVDDSEALLSSRFMGADDAIFRPSLPSEEVSRPGPEVGSVPVERRTVENPDCSRAYGSLSTFHQVGPATGASPISALRAARDSSVGSSSPSDSPKKLMPAAKIAPTGRTAQLAGESGSNFARRPSVSFQAFKAPPLSASPALVDTPLGASPRTASARLSGTSADSRFMPPPSVAAAARRPAVLASEHAIPSSTSASPKPAPLSRYSSSFSHRRGRPSSGGTARMEDDNSSGKASAASSNVQPGSGLLAEATGTSAESMHADDENISDFLKMLDTSKDLMNRSTNTASLEQSARNATAPGAALARFRGMRESHAALSDSMTSSMHIHRSSTSSSKQLSGVPPMVAGTSISTASSPGKPISPHTPHTPAIRSRLSSNSVADDIVTEHERQRTANIGQGSTLDEHPSLETTQHASAAAAIDIPTSPRVFDPSYRRSSSAAQHRRQTVSDDDEIFPFGMRSMSVGPPLPLPIETQQETEFAPENQSGQQSPSVDAPTAATSSSGPYRDATSTRGAGPTATSTSSTTNAYQPRFASSRGRGFSGGPQSLSSASSSLARGATIPPHLVERDADRDGNASGSNSGNSTLEIRRGSGHRLSTSRAPPSQVEDDEPLLFAMSDFGASRRSLEENRGNHGGSDSAGASRRGSGRRGAGLPGFHAWS